MHADAGAPWRGTVEDNDEVISNPLVALDTIAKYGYLTRLETPADEWYEIGRHLLDQDEYGERITMKTAVDLIAAGLVHEVARGNPPGDRTTRAVSYATAVPRQ